MDRDLFVLVGCVVWGILVVIDLWLSRSIRRDIAEMQEIVRAARKESAA
jgi:hypothetical protein